MSELAVILVESLTPGSSALFVLVRKATTDKVLDGLKAFAGKGKVRNTPFQKHTEEALRKVLDQA